MTIFSKSSPSLAQTRKITRGSHIKHSVWQPKKMKCFWGILNYEVYNITCIFLSHIFHIIKKFIEFYFVKHPITVYSISNWPNLLVYVISYARDVLSETIEIIKVRKKSYAPRQQSTIHLSWLYHFDLIKMMMEVFIHAHVHLALVYFTACVLCLYILYPIHF